MSSRKRYKLWRKNDNVPIPRRTLTRLKKKAKDYVDNIHVADVNERFDQVEPTEVFVTDEEDFSGTGSVTEGTERYETHQSEDSDLEEQTSYQYDEECSQWNNFSGVADVPESDVQDQFHLPEESDYRDYDNYICEFESSESDTSDCDTEEETSNIRVPIYPGALITVEDSILSIMKFANRQKTTYSALSDLLGLISLHLPKESNKEHLKSLYFLKKAFSADDQKDDIVTTHEYCSACFAPLEKHGDITCRFCGKENPRKKRNYFLSLDVGEQIKSMFKERDFLKDLEYGFQARELSRSKLDCPDREWHDIMDGDLYRDLLKPGGFLTNKHNLSLTFNTDGVHVFKASRDEIWPILVMINEIHPSVRMSTKRMILAGIWFGPSKPSMPTFLTPFREQMNKLKRNGISVDCNGESFICRAVCLIGTADLPGKCALQGFTQYNGMCGCSFCETEGERVPVMKGNCQVYPYSAGPPKNVRTKNKTVKDGKVAQQKAEPWLRPTNQLPENKSCTFQPVYRLAFTLFSFGVSSVAKMDRSPPNGIPRFNLNEFGGMNHGHSNQPSNFMTNLSPFPNFTSSAWQTTSQSTPQPSSSITNLSPLPNFTSPAWQTTSQSTPQTSNHLSQLPFTSSTSTATGTRTTKTAKKRERAPAWTTQEEEALIRLYKAELEISQKTGKKSQTMWTAIAEKLELELKELGFPTNDRSAQKVKEKFFNTLRRYKQCKDKLKTSGEGSEEIEICPHFDLLDEFMGSKDSINPKFVVESSGSSSASRPSTPSTTDGGESDDASDSFDLEGDNQQSNSKKRTSAKTKKNEKKKKRKSDEEDDKWMTFLRESQAREERMLDNFKKSEDNFKELFITAIKEFGKIVKKD
ncbi:hypothetical protein QZH41_020083 [Actinostola sp. cb2023]|nr:hypothetical protein QZH41_020083 [Actinostola sp. cb2023]